MSNAKRTLDEVTERLHQLFDQLVAGEIASDAPELLAVQHEGNTLAAGM